MSHKAYAKRPLEERLMRRVERIPEAGCWIWMGATNQAGYGAIGTGAGPRVHPTHRVAYQLFKGAIGAGLQVCHHCDVPACCNPDHLFLGTAKDNSDDKMAKGRHKLSPNVYPGVGVDLRVKSLTKRMRNQIIALRMAGESLKSLASQFDMTELAASEICSRTLISRL